MINDEFSDEELIYLISCGSQSAEAAFYERYFKYSKVLAKDYLKEFGLDACYYDELTSVIFSKLPTILEKYQRIETKFNLYWKKAIRNTMLDYFKDNQNYFYTRENTVYISLDDYPYANNEELTFHDVIGDEEEPEDTSGSETIAKVKSLITDKNSPLNEEEKIAANLLFFEDMKTGEIIKKTGWRRDHTNYVIRNMKTKVIKIIKDSYL